MDRHAECSGSRDRYPGSATQPDGSCARRDPELHWPMQLRCSFDSAAQTVGYHAAIFRELGHHSPVKRDILFGAAIGTFVHAQLIGQLLTRPEARIEVEQLQKV